MFVSPTFAEELVPLRSKVASLVASLAVLVLGLAAGCASTGDDGDAGSQFETNEFEDPDEGNQGEETEDFAFGDDNLNVFGDEDDGDGEPAEGGSNYNQGSNADYGDNGSYGGNDLNAANTYGNGAANLYGEAGGAQGAGENLNAAFADNYGAPDVVTEPAAGGDSNNPGFFAQSNPTADSPNQPAEEVSEVSAEQAAPEEAVDIGYEQATEGEMDYREPDVMPASAELRWVGYDYNKDEKQLRVELVTVGKPRYELFQERNQARQPELVIRFFETAMRRRLKYDIDASEFRSPVAYIRMRNDINNQQVDVVLTLRDNVRPRLLDKDGSLLLTFDVPDRYFAPAPQGPTLAEEIAEALSSVNILPLAVDSPLNEEGGGAEVSKAFVPDPGAEAFGNVPEGSGNYIEEIPDAPVGEYDEQGLPQNFNATQDGMNGTNAAMARETPLGNQAVNGYGGANAYNQGAQGNNYGNSYNNQGAQGNNYGNSYNNQSDDYNIEGSNSGGNGGYNDQQFNNEGNDFDNEDFNDENSGNNYDGAALDGGYDKFAVVRSFSLAAVAQDGNDYNDEGFNDFEEEGDDAGGDDYGFDEGGNAPANGGNYNNSYNNGGNAAQGNIKEENFANPSYENISNSDYSFGNGGQAGSTPAANAEGGYNGGSGLINNPAANEVFNNGGGYNEVVPANTPEDSAQLPLDPPVNADLEGSDQPMAANQGPFKGRPVTLEFYRAPLNLVLKTFSEESGNNFIYPGEVANTEITIRLKDVPWDEALKAILETYGLGMVLVGENVVRIDKIDKMTSYLRELNAAQEYRNKLLPTKVLVMRLSHGLASDVAIQLQNLLAEDVTRDPRIKIAADNRTNSIVAEASPQVLTKIKTIIDRLDLETPQVEISSRIVEVTRSAQDFLGVVWANSLNFDPGRGLGFGTLPFPNSLTSDFSVDPGVTDQTTAGNLSLRFGSLNKFFDLDLLLKMEEKKGTTNVLQSNRVLVLDRQPASIISGSSQFFRPAAGGNVIQQGGTQTGGGGGDNPSGGLSEVQFNLQLQVTPEITAGGAINMQLLITSETPGEPTGEALANKNNRSLTTKMTRRSGETAVIGGIYDTKRSKNVTGVPYLSSLPIIGALFRSTTVSESQTEMLIMVTPTLMNLADNSGMAMQGSAGALPADQGEFAVGASNLGNGYDGNLDTGNNYVQNQAPQGDVAAPANAAPADNLNNGYGGGNDAYGEDEGENTGNEENSFNNGDFNY